MATEKTVVVIVDFIRLHGHLAMNRLPVERNAMPRRRDGAGVVGMLSCYLLVPNCLPRSCLPASAGVAALCSISLAIRLDLPNHGAGPR